MPPIFIFYMQSVYEKRRTHIIKGETAAVYSETLFLRLVINNCVSSHMWLMVIRTVCKNYLITPRVSNARKIRYVTNNSNILAKVLLTRGLMVRNDKLRNGRFMLS